MNVSKKISNILFSVIFIFISCSKKETSQLYSNSITNPSPTPFAIACENRSVINATLIPVGKLSTARINLQCASAGNKILFIGGMHEGNNWWNEPVPVDIYDIISDTWSTHFLIPDNPNLSHYRFGAAVASVGNKILFAGGGDPIGDIQTSRVDIYDASSNSWSFTHLSKPRFMLAASTVGDKVLFAGGYGYTNGTNWGEFNTVDIFNNSTNTWSIASLSEARAELSATTVGNKIYFAGGKTSLRTSKVIDVYDAISNSWTATELKYPRAQMTSISTDDKIFWAGGSNNNSGYSEEHKNVEVLNLITQKVTIECMPPKSGLNAVSKENNLIFFTGFNQNTNLFEIYNKSQGVWFTGKMDKAICGAAIITVNNTTYVAGGRVNGAYSNQVWKLEF